MTDAERLEKLDKDIVRLHGKFDNLTTLLGVYQSQVSKMEGRMWGSAGAAIIALATAILSFIFRN